MKVRTVGDRDWRDMRFILVKLLEDANTEEKFSKALQVILISCGTPKEMKKRRKQLGLKPFTKDELKEMKK